MGIFGKSKSEKAADAMVAVGTGLATLGLLGLAVWADNQEAKIQEAERLRRVERAEKDIVYWGREAERLWARGDRDGFLTASRELRRA